MSNQVYRQHSLASIISFDIGYCRIDYRLRCNQVKWKLGFEVLNFLGCFQSASVSLPVRDIRISKSTSWCSWENNKVWGCGMCSYRGTRDVRNWQNTWFYFECRLQLMFFTGNVLTNPQLKHISRIVSVREQSDCIMSWIIYS